MATTDDSTVSMLTETAQKLFAGKASEALNDTLWSSMQDAGFPLALLPEDQGGFGFTAREAFIPVWVAASHAIASPLGETMLANWLLGRAGVDPVDGPAGIVIVPTDGSTVVPFGRHLRSILMVSDKVGETTLSLYRPRADDWTMGTTHAGEAQDILSLPANAEVLRIDVSLPTLVIEAILATLRSVQMAGAIDAVANMCLRYCEERKQFGRSLGKFQAIQHQLAVLASNGCAAATAADMATAAFDKLSADPDQFVIIAAAAKVRTSEAATEVAAIAHQVHGAIGFSQEYPLHHLTRRLWGWRDAGGAEMYWAEQLGKWARDCPSEDFWPALTALDQQVA